MVTKKAKAKKQKEARLSAGIPLRSIDDLDPLVSRLFTHFPLDISGCIRVVYFCINPVQSGLAKISKTTFNKHRNSGYLFFDSILDARVWQKHIFDTHQLHVEVRATIMMSDRGWTVPENMRKS